MASNGAGPIWKIYLIGIRKAKVPAVPSSKPIRSCGLCDEGLREFGPQEKDKATK